jgi:hypothetical protein
MFTGTCEHASKSVPNGGSRARVVTSERHAARLMFQKMSEPNADSVLEHCQVQPSRTALISTIPVHQSDQLGNGWPRAKGSQEERSGFTDRFSYFRHIAAEPRKR